MDLGSGPTADTGWDLAANRTNRPVSKHGRFVSVDLERMLPVNSRGQLFTQPHHSFHQTDVWDHFRKTRSNSVKVIQDSYLLVFFLVEKTLSDSKMPRTEHVSVDSERYLKQVHRILVPNGRFTIYLNPMYVPTVRKALEKTGFQVLSEKTLTEEEIMKGKSETAKRRLIEVSPHQDRIDAEFAAREKYEIFFNALGHPGIIDAEKIRRTVRINAKKPAR
ncbi:MAG: hypothetical protein J4215_03695 [Candidatus Diapherotrites archaeon]|uniref:Uncharacterized protein n=1 Tax=Candidatus Iainarchaeum sp. TaxID=3101447 RepID=A0A8T4L4C6_9ARCH|nr:hypothetical protein [Candidatus Diapherotrites archaeon]